jgi:hypothetical protein
MLISGTAPSLSGFLPVDRNNCYQETCRSGNDCACQERGTESPGEELWESVLIPVIAGPATEKTTNARTTLKNQRRRGWIRY